MCISRFVPEFWEYSNLQKTFLYAQGARYVKALKERGGWVSVNFAVTADGRAVA